MIKDKLDGLRKLDLVGESISERKTGLRVVGKAEALKVIKAEIKKHWHLSCEEIAERLRNSRHQWGEGDRVFEPKSGNYTICHYEATHPRQTFHFWTLNIDAEGNADVVKYERDLC